MASNPLPYQVEDNTDEDFFDKLVDDDDDMGLVTKPSASSSITLNDGNETDMAKAFSNLTMSDQGNSDDFNFINDDDFRGKVDTGVEPGNGTKALDGKNSLPSVNSFSFEQCMPGLSDKNEGAELLADSNLSNDTVPQGSSDVIASGESAGASGVKEVDWSAFHTNAAQNSSNGFGSYSNFFTEFGMDDTANEFDKIVGDGSQIEPNSSVDHAQMPLYANSFNSSVQYNEGYTNGMVSDQNSVVQDLNNSQYWEEQYPGWKYDASSGQWFQVDDYNANSAVLENTTINSSTWGVVNGNSESLYVQKNPQSITGDVAESGLTGSVYSFNQGTQLSDSTGNSTNWNVVSDVSSESNGVLSDWNQVSHTNTGYPPNIVFDPQYPGWYYDTTLQQWLTLESYTASAPSSVSFQNHRIDDSYSSTTTFSQNDSAMPYETNGSQTFGSQVSEGNWLGSISNYQQPNSRDQHFEKTPEQSVSKSVTASYESSFPHAVQNKLTESLTHTQRLSLPSQYAVDGNSTQYFNDSKANVNELSHFSGDHHINQSSVNFIQPLFQGVQAPYVPASGRLSAGRPSHALVAFGFGGKLVVLKPNSSNENMSFVNQNHLGGQLSILNMADVAKAKLDTAIHGRGENDFFRALCDHPIPGPLTSGFGGMKELNKWIDESIAKLEPSNMNRVLQLLLSLLKIACQHYGKLRSPYGTDVLKENESPESAVARLFASAKGNDPYFNQYATTSRCLQQLPSDVQVQSAAAEVQKLLVSGRKREALQCAQEGQLWGPAIVLAAQLGDQFYAETVKEMALRQLVAGSPLRTLCLLIAGFPADVFSADSASSGTLSGAMNMPQETMQCGVNGMLDDWEENLAVITANRTKGDELVLVHLGDCLWKERSDIIAAHICYLVAEAVFEPYSDSARLCLLGADHWKSPRTYASAEAIQRTEIYEYSKTLGNSQFVLLPFQPYKFVYAMMLVEVGRISEALKYCQAVLKSLKTGRNPEVENLRHLVSSLEDRIKGHQQGGFSANPKEFIGKLLNLFDSTAQRVVGGMPPAPSSVGVPHGNDNNYQAMGTRVSASQSTMAMSSLVPSQSMEPISDWAGDGNRKTKHIRSVSEPDFGRSPMKGQADEPAEASSSAAADKPSATGSTSRFARFNFGSQLLQKTVGLVLNRQGRQAKLGDTNKFYYDEKLKRWVEEGAEPPPEENLLPPPPLTTAVATFQNGNSEFNVQSSFPVDASSHYKGSPEMKTPNSLDNNSGGMPPLPPTTNHLASRGRMGVRQRYVDTFNQGVGNTRSFQSPAAPIKPATVGGNTKFFVPASISTTEEPTSTAAYSNQNDSSTTSQLQSDSLEPSPSPATVQRIGSMNSISNKTLSSSNGSIAPQSRRSASWSGSFNGSFSPPPQVEVKPSAFMSSESPGGFFDELHEVEL